MMTTRPEKEWLTYMEVVRRIEACLGSNGKYTLGLWIQGDEPVLPRVYFPGKKRGLYSAERVRELLRPVGSNPNANLKREENRA